MDKQKLYECPSCNGQENTNRLVICLGCEDKGMIPAEQVKRVIMLMYENNNLKILSELEKRGLL